MFDLKKPWNKQIQMIHETHAAGTTLSYVPNSFNVTITLTLCNQAYVEI